MFTRCGAGAARAAHNREVTGSKPVAGIYHHIASVHQGTRAALNRGGAEEARGAHNSEVVGSNPTSGIIQFASFTEAGRHMLSDAKHSTIPPL